MIEQDNRKLATSSNTAAIAKPIKKPIAAVPIKTSFLIKKGFRPKIVATTFIDLLS